MSLLNAACQSFTTTHHHQKIMRPFFYHCLLYLFCLSPCETLKLPRCGYDYKPSSSSSRPPPPQFHIILLLLPSGRAGGSSRGSNRGCSRLNQITYHDHLGNGKDASARVSQTCNYEGIDHIFRSAVNCARIMHNKRVCTSPLFFPLLPLQLPSYYWITKLSGAGYIEGHIRL